MIWFSSDTHFGHRKIIEYSKRPFKDENEMDQALIVNWNSVVKPDDVVYHLGDFSFRDATGTQRILDQLNGRIYFCRGNHDQVFRKNKHLQNRFEDVRDYYELKFQRKDGQEGRIVMCHFPMIVWNKSHHGSWMLHGHCHGTLKYPMKGKIMDVGSDPCKYFPIDIVDVEKHMSKLEGEVLDHHGRRDQST